MVDQIYIGNFTKGLTLNRLPFNIDNDAFPYMYNFYSWRGRAKRKRGTALLGQLQFQVSISATPANWQEQSFALVASAGNLVSQFTLGSSASIAPKTITLVVSGDQTYTDPNADGTLTGGSGGTGTINYSTGVFTVSGSITGTVTGTFSYYPGLPVMGLRDFIKSAATSEYPQLLSFDTMYSYQIQNTSGSFFYNTSFYRNSQNPVVWTGADYQLTWTTNYSGALWMTNNNPGMQFENIATVTVGATTAITTTLPHGLVTGDAVWFNELTGADAGLLNGIAAIITVTSTTRFTVAINTAGKTINNGAGIFQTLTATSPTSTGDGIRWYDGDPTASNGIPAATGHGWANFAPPLTALNVSINNLPVAKYYLVGAQFIVAYKDRLVFFSPWVQTSSGAAPIQLIDSVIWSWNGTPYYTVDSSGNPVNIPAGETASASAYYVDQTGLGGWISAGIDQPILAVTNNEDVLLVNFSNRSARFVYSGNDLYPFIFFLINSEFGSSSPLSSITLDRGGLCFGAKGILMTDQQSAQRIDLDIPDQVFQCNNSNNGAYRVNAARDFFREWIYFSYPALGFAAKFPTQTFLWNYRDNTWAVFYENFTAHGTYRAALGLTWATLPYETWAQWTEAWNSGSAAPMFPSIVGGNPQGYVLITGVGTAEGNSGTIAAVTNSGGNTQITSINHCVEIGDYLQFNSCLGTTDLNNTIGKVIIYVDANNFVVDVPFPAGTYLGLGNFIRLSLPLMQTKQFPAYWDLGRQARLSAQKYLLDATANGEITVNIYLSQDPNDPWNDPIDNPFVPENSLIYTQTVFTCPESTNIGLTPANTNLQMPTAESQFQIWHRMNTSLIGDSFQLGFTLSDAQMRDFTLATSEISLHGIVLTTQPGPHLA